MSGSYFVVDHVSDPNKKAGLVDGFTILNFEVDGQVIPKRVNFVIWPELPNPFTHEEFSENLIFTNVYTPLLDDDQDDEEEEEGEEYEDDGEGYEMVEGESELG